MTCENIKNEIEKNYNISLGKKHKKRVTDEIFDYVLIYIEACKKYAHNFTQYRCSELINRDHSSICIGLKKIENRLSFYDPSLKTYYARRETILDAFEQVYLDFEFTIDKETFYSIDDLIESFVNDKKKQQNKIKTLTAKCNRYKNKLEKICNLELID